MVTWREKAAFPTEEQQALGPGARGRCLPRRRVGRRPFARPRVGGGEEAVAARARRGALTALGESRVAGPLRLGEQMGIFQLFLPGLHLVFFFFSVLLLGLPWK